ncbi:hypothetical protein ABBQ38_006928 [Trebouxia sp. C0009 RCD-2024]
MVRTLVVGSTGVIGLPLTLALTREGHEVFAIVRKASRQGKKAVVAQLEAAGVRLVDGDIADSLSLQETFTQLHPIEAVVSAVAGTQVLDQSNLIAACLRAGTVKRFLPSEYNVDISSAQSEVPDIFGPRAAILEELQESQIPYTLICSNGFMEYWNAGLGVLAAYPPDPVLVYGDGNVKGVSTLTTDIAAYAAKALTDPRTENKRLIVAPPQNVASQNDLIALWEKVSGKQLGRKHLSATELQKQIQDAQQAVKGSDNYSNVTYLQLIQTMWIMGDTVHPLPPDGVEASALYPEVKFTTLESYLTQLAQKGPPE